MGLIVDSRRRMAWAGGRAMACAIGRSGAVAATDKREGDGATPLGRFVIREVMWRGDRGPCPKTGLRTRAISPRDGWSDDPADPRYNSLVGWPHPFSAEHLWRRDRLYDVVAVLGWNDRPALPGRGSAIFLHVAHPCFHATEGCVALTPGDLAWVLARSDSGARITIR